MSRHSPAKLRRVVAQTAADYGMTVERMVDHCRGDRDAYHARRAAAATARAMGVSFTVIGAALNRDHSTIVTLLRGRA